jgi:hypothetical protein
MANETKKAMPKGGRKGGSSFPRLRLAKAIEYAQKLVAKTHTGPQPGRIIFLGVLDAGGPVGGVRASALKQYGLMEGDSKGYKASELAKKIEAAPAEERPALIRTALLRPRVFRALFDTFQNDSANKAKYRQQAIAMNVHPDTAQECVDTFVESAVYAQLATIEGETVTLKASTDGTDYNIEEAAPHEAVDSVGGHEGQATAQSAEDQSTTREVPSTGAAHPAVTVSISVDSSLDAEKLAKQLELLRKYGVL